MPPNLPSDALEGLDQGPEPRPDLERPPEPEEPTRAALPRLPASPRRPRRPESPPNLPDGGRTEPGYARSSPESSDPPGPPPRPQPAPVSPENFRAALRQAADVAFVVVGQGIGWAHSRAKREPKIAERWIPTPTERQFVLDPASRIAGRHLHSDQATADTVDGCLIGVGLGHFVMRAGFDIDPLEPLQEDNDG